MAKYTLATKLNVQPGDLLVVNLPMGRGVEAVPIRELKEDQIVAFGQCGSACERYDNAIVLRKDGSYLLGKNAAAWVEKAEAERR